MKTIYKTSIAGMLAAFFVLTACSKMNDLSDKFLDEGEIIYAAKVDTVTALAGKNRIQLDIFVRSQRIETIRVFWNNNTDSSDLVIGNNTGMFYKLINQIEERTYLFHLISLDKFGNRSLPYELSGQAYGAEFQSVLANRDIRSTDYLNKQLVIKWGSTIDKGIATDVIYTNINGEEVLLRVPINEKETAITDWQFATSFKYNTLFLPEPAAIDTFVTDYAVVSEGLNKMERTGWKATANSYETKGQLPNGPADRLLDGDVMTYWHSRHTNEPLQEGQEDDPGKNTPGYPYWLVFDMGKKINVDQVELTSRNDGNEMNNAFKKFRIQSSDDGTTWNDDDKTYGEFNHAVTKAPQKYTPESPLSTRYIRIYMTEGASNHCGMSEFAVYGTEAE